MLETQIEILPNGHQLRIARIGKGQPIVFLHGYPDNLQIWSNLSAELLDKYETIAFDWPGMGYSSSWTGGATPWHMADRLLELLNMWKIERVCIVASDMGGQPALVFASKFSERMHKLVVMNCLAFPDESTSWEIKLLRKFQWNRLILGNLPRIVFKRAEWTFLPRNQSLPVDLKNDLWQAFYKKEVRKFIIRMCAGYQGTLNKLPLAYSQITCPTLILWGEHDKHFPPQQGKRLHSAIANSQFRIIAGAHHWMNLYLAKVLGEEIRKFIN